MVLELLRIERNAGALAVPGTIPAETAPSAAGRSIPSGVAIPDLVVDYVLDVARNGVATGAAA
jgi:hypothetical protein